MKRNLLILIIALALALFCFCPVFAEEAAPEFTFLFDGMEAPITLATPPEEAAALLGEATQYREETLDPVGTFFTIVNDSGLRFADTECMKVVLSYYNDELFMLSFYITEDALPDAQPLIDEMTVRYGEGIENTETGEPLLFLSPVPDRVWNVGEEISIEYYHVPENDAFAHMIGIQNKTAIQKLEAAFNQSPFLQ